MPAEVIPFELKRPFNEVVFLGHLRTGEPYFVVDMHVEEDIGGGVAGMWSGSCLEEAIAVAREMEAGGLPYVISPSARAWMS